MFDSENPRKNLLEITGNTFSFNPFGFKVFVSSYAKLVLFSQPVQNFYLQEAIAGHSQTRAECSLFLGQESNFVSEMLLGRRLLFFRTIVLLMIVIF